MLGGALPLTIGELGSIVAVVGGILAAAFTIYRWGKSHGKTEGTGASVVPGFLRPIDTQEIAATLKLQSSAVADAHKELPPSNAGRLDSKEQEVTQKITSEWTWQGEALLNELAAYASRLAQYSIRSVHERLRLTAQNAITRLQNENVRAPAELGPLKQAYIEARDEFAAFREQHRLRRPVRENPGRWTTFGLMFILIAVESVLNGTFFAKGSDFGLIGGVGTAIGIAIANVVFAFLIGLAPARWMSRRNLLVKVLGLLLTVVGLAALLALHAFAAQYREAVALLGDERAFPAAADALLKAPWRVTDISSIYLFALGTLFSIAAFWKGYTFDDPYPGYGAVHRRLVKSREDYSDHHALLFDELESIKEKVVDDLEKGIAHMPLFPQQADTIRAQRAALIERFRAYEAAVEAAANQLLAAYRAANRAERKTPTPAYFAEAWRLPHSFLDKKNAVLVDDLGSPQLGPLLAELRELSRAVLGAYEDLIRNFPHPTEMQ
jgi:hypothetical protein